MADAHGSGPCVRKDVGVQLPPRPHTHDPQRSVRSQLRSPRALRACRASRLLTCRGDGSTMAGMTSIPVEAWFTADDLDTLPDDGNRYELLDGQLLVTPSPRLRHQAVSLELAVLLRQALPPGLRLLPAP